MTNKEFQLLGQRLLTLRPYRPGDRAGLEAAVVTLRAAGGRFALVADRLTQVLWDYDAATTAVHQEYNDELTKITAEYVIDTTKAQSTSK